MCCVLNEWRDVFEVFRQRSERELFRNSLHAPWLGNWFEPTDQQLACIFLEVTRTILVAKHWHGWRNSLNSFGHDVEVLGCMQWNCCSNLAAKFASPHTCSVYNCFGTNNLSFNLNANSATVFNNDAIYFYVFNNAHSVCTCTFCKSLRYVNWVHHAVTRQVHCTNHVVYASKWHKFLHICRSDDVHRQTEYSRH